MIGCAVRTWPCLIGSRGLCGGECGGTPTCRIWKLYQTPIFFGFYLQIVLYTLRLLHFSFSSRFQSLTPFLPSFPCFCPGILLVLKIIYKAQTPRLTKPPLLFCSSSTALSSVSSLLTLQLRDTAYSTRLLHPLLLHCRPPCPQCLPLPL